MSELYALNWRRVKWFFGCVLPRHPVVGFDATRGGCGARRRLPDGTFFSRSPQKWWSFSLGGSPNFDPVFRALPGPARRPNLAGGCPLMWRTTYLVSPPNCHREVRLGEELNALNWRRVKWFFGCVLPRHPVVGFDATRGGCGARRRLPDGTFFSRSPKNGGVFWGFPKLRPVFRALPGPARRPNLAGGCPLMWRTTYLCFPQIGVGGTAGGRNNFFQSSVPVDWFSELSK
jgi:hypothetical protein